MDKNILLEIAKKAISDTLTGNKSLEPDIQEHFIELKEKRATFVTLNLHGQLRGCIGSLTPYRSLFDDIVSNAKAAAFNDPRFMPLDIDEFKHIEIEISLLTLPQEVYYQDINDLKNKIRVGVDGVILTLEGRRATFLPSVWEQLSDFDLFFVHLCQKAGLEGRCLNHHPKIEIYQTEKIK